MLFNHASVLLLFIVAALSKVSASPYVMHFLFFYLLGSRVTRNNTMKWFS